MLKKLLARLVSMNWGQSGAVQEPEFQVAVTGDLPCSCSVCSAYSAPEGKLIEVWDWYAERKITGDIFRINGMAESEAPSRLSNPEDLILQRIDGTARLLPKFSPFPYFD